MTELDILAAMGWQVIEVPGMPSRVCVVAGERVALIRAGMRCDDYTEACGWALTTAITAESTQGRTGTAVPTQRGR